VWYTPGWRHWVKPYDLCRMTTPDMHVSRTNIIGPSIIWEASSLSDTWMPLKSANICSADWHFKLSDVICRTWLCALATLTVASSRTYTLKNSFIVLLSSSFVNDSTLTRSDHGCTGKVRSQKDSAPAQNVGYVTWEVRVYHEYSWWIELTLARDGVRLSPTHPKKTLWSILLA